MGGEPTISKPIHIWENGELHSRKDSVANESPIEISVSISGVEQSLGIIMRTPGDDGDLTIGFLLGESVIKSMDDIHSIKYFEGKVLVELNSSNKKISDLPSRKFTINSSCGICGTEELENYAIPDRLNISDEKWLDPKLLINLPRIMKPAQRNFEDTGGLHAAALYDQNSNLMAIKEDVGRHNALDKLIGSRLKSGDLPAEYQVLMLTGRIGYELIQKAAYGGLPVVVGLGAPTTMAVDAARSTGITLIGFLKEEKFNVYCGAWRIL